MNSSFECQQCARRFYVEAKEKELRESILFSVEDKTYTLPPPQLCPVCRYQRRLANRNEWSLYHRKCDATGKQIISIYAANNPLRVYEQEYWWSNQWDPHAYGFEFDCAKTFFAQFEKLRRLVPRLCITNPHCENSRYTNQGSHNTDCYLLVASNFNTKCLYGSWIQKSTEAVDSYLLSESSECYECVYCSNVQRGRFLIDCHQCSEAWFSVDCYDCSSIFGCHGLKGARYCVFNRQVDEAEWLSFVRSFEASPDAIQEICREVERQATKNSQKTNRGRDNIDSLGDYIEECVNATRVINARRCKNLAFGQDAWEATGSLDHTETLSTSQCCEMEGSMLCRNSLGITRSWELQNAFYSELCFNSQHLFGCVGLRNREFCIFNVQYSQKEYFRRVPTIIEHMQRYGEWGEFFPISSSPFAYNESVAQDYFPLQREQVVAQGWGWRELASDEMSYIGPKRNPPALILSTSEDALKQIYSCEDTGRPYRFIKEELLLSRRLGVPLSRKCPDRRRALRMERAGRTRIREILV